MGSPNFSWWFSFMRFDPLLLPVLLANKAVFGGTAKSFAGYLIFLPLLRMSLKYTEFCWDTRLEAARFCWDARLEGATLIWIDCTLLSFLRSNKLIAYDIEAAVYRKTPKEEPITNQSQMTRHTRTPPRIAKVRTRTNPQASCKIPSSPPWSSLVKATGGTGV